MTAGAKTVNDMRIQIAAAMLLSWALAACSGSPSGSVGKVDLLSDDVGLDGVPERDSGGDTQPVDLQRDNGLPDAEGIVEPLDLVPETELSVWPDVLPTDAKEVDVESEEPYYCPLGQDGKKELMPPCQYDLPSFLFGMQYIGHGPIQFEVYSTGSAPGLPDGFVVNEDQSVALLRFRWMDPWTEVFAEIIGCPPDWSSCEACGGHCFPPQGYVHVIDLATLTVVYSAKEELAPELFSAEHCKNPNGSNSILCYELKVPELAVRLSLEILGQWHTGTSNVIPDNLKVWHIKASFPDPPIKAIPLPLF